jgi:hypothetical protein
VPLLLGLAAAGALGVALAAMTHAPETRVSPIEPRTHFWHVALIVGLAVAFVAYVVAVFAARATAVSVVAVAAVAVVIQLAPLSTPLLLSHDVYLYWDYGRIAVVHDGNPFSDFPNRWPADPAYKQIAGVWGRLRSPYGPAWVLAGEGAAKVSGSSTKTAELYFRLVAAAAMLALIGIVARSTRSAFSTVLVGWNPLLALHFAGGGHSEAALMALVAAALALALRHPRWSGAAWAGAVAIKVTALAFLGVELIYRLRERARAWFVGLIVAGVAAIAASLAIFGTSFFRAGGPISNQLRAADSVGIPTKLHELGLSLHQAQLLAVACFALLYLWVLREAWHGRRRHSLAAGGLCLAISWLMPWYASWPVVLAAFDRDRAGTLLGLGLSGYLLYDVLPI